MKRESSNDPAPSIRTPPAGDAAPSWVVVAADVPLAPATHGNRVRNVELVAGLRAAGFRVVYLYWERNAREGDVAAMRALVDELVVVSVPRGAYARRKARFLRGVAGTLRARGVIGEAAWWRLVEEDESSTCPAALVEALARVLDARAVAGMIASYANLWPLARAARERGVVAVIDTHDLMHARAAKLFAERIRPTGLLVRREVEARWLAEADLVVAIQDREAEELRRLLTGGGARAPRVLSIGHGVALPRLSSPAADPAGASATSSHPVAASEARGADERALSILGSNNRPNQHGLEWFVSACWPTVLQALPDAELRVFGLLSKTAACSGPHVRAMGEVDDPRTAQESALVAVNPVRAGSGLKIKTVDALAWGRAVVTTSIGAEGLEDGAGSAFVVADEPDAFARACLAFLRDPTLARQQGRRARAYAERRFAPERVYAPLVDALRARH